MTGLEKLLRWHSLRGGISTQDATATGNPVTFVTTLARPLKQCNVTFFVVQEGTGDPSPDNVRHIDNAWKGITVYHSGADTTQPDVINVAWESEAGTIYGGYIDLVNGTLTKTHNYIEFDGSADESWSVETPSMPNFYIMISDAKVNQSAGMACNYALPNNDLSNNRCKITSSRNFNIRIGLDIGISTVDDFKVWLETHPIQLVYELDTAQSYQLTAQQIIALGGSNTVWSDSNGDIDITYIKKG